MKISSRRKMKRQIGGEIGKMINIQGHREVVARKMENRRGKCNADKEREKHQCTEGKACWIYRKNRTKREEQNGMKEVDVKVTVKADRAKNNRVKTKIKYDWKKARKRWRQCICDAKTKTAEHWTRWKRSRTEQKNRWDGENRRKMEVSYIG